MSIHNGGGVGWGEVINGGFGMVVDGSEDADRHIREMLLWDVNNAVARRSWARNEGAMSAIRREMERTPGLQVTLPNVVDEELIRNILKETNKSLSLHMEHHHISAEHLSLARIREILERHLPLALSDDARIRIVRCREYLDRKMENLERPVYGITTGFGSLCDISVGYDEWAQLQKNLVMSHACGTGERVPSEVVKPDPAAQDPVAFLRPFGRAPCDRGAADRLFQQRPPARGLPAGFRWAHRATCSRWRT